MFFDILLVNMSADSKTDSEFSRETWQTGSKCFTLVGVHFSGKSIRPLFFAAVKDIYLQRSKNLPLQTLLFSCLKFVSRRMRCAVKILEDSTEGNSRLSQIKL